MKANRMGMHVKRNIGNVSNTLFKKIAKLLQTDSRLHTEAGLAENALLQNETEKALLEAEVKKNQAIELVRGFQNC